MNLHLLVAIICASNSKSSICFQFRVFRNESIRRSSLIVFSDSCAVKVHRKVNNMNICFFFSFHNIIGHFLKPVGTYPHIILRYIEFHFTTSTPNNSIFAPHAFLNSMKVFYIVTGFLMNSMYSCCSVKTDVKLMIFVLNSNCRKYS